MFNGMFLPGHFAYISCSCLVNRSFSESYSVTASLLSKYCAGMQIVRTWSLFHQRYITWHIGLVCSEIYDIQLYWEGTWKPIKNDKIKIELYESLRWHVINIDLLCYYGLQSQYNEMQI